MVLVPEDPEDMWHDNLKEGIPSRPALLEKVTTESATGSTYQHRVQTIHLTVSVETIHFDTQACMLCLKGRARRKPICEDGAYHTIDLELNKEVYASRKDSGTACIVDRIELACDPTNSADIAAVVLQEGLAPRMFGDF